jgi:hypothetical protein
MTNFYMQYPPLPNQTTQQFIDDTGIVTTGNMMDDFRSALVESLSTVVTDHNKYTLDDLWQLYIIHITSGDPNAEAGNPAGAGRGKQGFVGQSPGQYYDEGTRGNSGKGFPAGLTGGVDLTPFNGTPVYDGTDYDTGQSYGLTFANNGSQFFTHDAIANQIQAFDMSTAWDVSTASGGDTIAEPSTSPASGLSMSPDGLFLIGHFGAFIYWTTLSTAYDITSNGGWSNKSRGGQGMHITPDGNYYYLCTTGLSNRRIINYDMTTPFDPSTDENTAHTQIVVDAQTTNGSPYDVTASEDGLWVYVSRNDNQSFLTYELTTAHDLTTATYKGEFDPGETMTNLTIHWSSPKQTIYGIGSAENDIYGYQA